MNISTKEIIKYYAIIASLVFVASLYAYDLFVGKGDIFILATYGSIASGFIGVIFSKIKRFPDHLLISSIITLVVCLPISLMTLFSVAVVGQYIKIGNIDIEHEDNIFKVFMSCAILFIISSALVMLISYYIPYRETDW